ncbi:MAG: hypothetical protein Q9M17_06560 [Mariprofundus sp.]|nr:hypothetical protein [Mariprofundus sp.]
MKSPFIYPSIIMALIAGALMGWFSHQQLGTLQSPQQPVLITEPQPAAGANHQAAVSIEHRKIITAPQPNASTSDPLAVFRQLLKQRNFSRALVSWPYHSSEQARLSLLELSTRLQHDGMNESALLLLGEYPQTI